MMIDWHYIKYENIPLNGRIIWVAVHDNKTGENYVIKVRCGTSNIFLLNVSLLTNESVVYAWAPFDSLYECDIIPAPVYMEEE